MGGGSDAWRSLLDDLAQRGLLGLNKAFAAFWNDAPGLAENQHTGIEPRFESDIFIAGHRLGLLIAPLFTFISKMARRSGEKNKAPRH